MTKMDRFVLWATITGVAACLAALLHGCMSNEQFDTWQRENNERCAAMCAQYPSYAVLELRCNCPQATASPVGLL